MTKYTIKYSGAVQVEADTEQEAIDKAWVDEAIHAEDIESINPE